MASRKPEPCLREPRFTDLAADAILTHNAEADSPALAELLAALNPPAFPMAFGVFRQVSRPVYEELLMEQVHEATRKRGPGDLARLFKSGTTWQVE